MVSIRPATEHDQRIIRRLVWQARLAPFDLHWPKFLVAVDEENEVLGCVQVRLCGAIKELSSLVVRADRRGQGIGATLVREMLKREPSELFLLCEPALTGFYQSFGFERISFPEAPAAIKVRLVLANLFGPLVRQRRFVAMRRSAPTAAA